MYRSATIVFMRRWSQTLPLSNRWIRPLLFLIKQTKSPNVQCGTWRKLKSPVELFKLFRLDCLHCNSYTYLHRLFIPVVLVYLLLASTVKISLYTVVSLYKIHISYFSIHTIYDVIEWKPFSRYWPFVGEIHRSPVNSPHKGQWRGALVFSLMYVLNKRMSKQSWGWRFEMPLRSLWRHCNGHRIIISYQCHGALTN